MAGSRDDVGDGWVPVWPHIGYQGPGPFIDGLPPAGLDPAQICAFARSVAQGLRLLSSPRPSSTPIVSWSEEMQSYFPPQLPRLQRTGLPYVRSLSPTAPFLGGMSNYSLRTRRSYGGRLPCPPLPNRALSSVLIQCWMHSFSLKWICL